MVRQFQDPLVYLLLVAIVVALGAWLVEGAHGVPVDAIVIAAIVVANAAIGFVQEAKAEDGRRGAGRHDGGDVDGPARRPSDDRSRRAVSCGATSCSLAEGDAVGADARILTATGLRVQEAPLTGESDAVDQGPRTLG